MTPIANVRPADRQRAFRITLGFIRRDTLAIDDVLTETADDETPGATAALVLALTELLVLQIGDEPGIDEGLNQLLIEYAAKTRPLTKKED